MGGDDEVTDLGESHSYEEKSDKGWYILYLLVERDD
jgi:hypothetical protein